MLEVKNLVKQYKTKGGVVTNALDDVSIKFPETGMIFLLGKSGSGKSTLLNVIGGLDKPDKGEIIIKGKNSKSFSGADFDSYRNTFIGFIFQEYNILNEFNVEQNISLALQLQGKPNDKKTVDDLLKQVDLSGLGKRKPNTLSGGQKQRVAIARALIKNPEIIMADEPTGALDSNTGKQVFDTLKKLSETKLIIVVSHDRDFAEFYGDRIIELSDGKIISDVSKEYIKPVEASSNVNLVNKNTLTIKDASKLTKEDMDVIYKSLKDIKGEAVISSGERDLPLVRQAIHINNDNSSEIFNETKEVNVKEYNPNDTKFIRSHLPFARAFKMGSSSLKTKPIRLIFTSFLTIVALTMFGLTSTLMLFKESYALSKALRESYRDTELISKEYNYVSKHYRKNNFTEKEELMETYKDNYNQTMFSKEDIDSLNSNNQNLFFSGVYRFNREGFEDINTDMGDEREYYVKTDLQGFVEINDEFLSRNNFSMEEGKIPSSKDEIVISRYMYDILKKKYSSTSYKTIIGKTFKIRLGGDYDKGKDYTFKISGVANVGDINSKYDVLKTDDTSISNEERNNLRSELDDYLENSYHTMIYVGKDFYSEYYYPIMGDKDIYYQPNGNEMERLNVQKIIMDENPYWHEEWWNPEELNWSGRSIILFDSLKDLKLDVYDLKGKKTTLKDSLGEKEIYLDYTYFNYKEREAYSRYFDRSREIMDYHYYDNDAYTYFEDADNRNAFNELTNRLQNYYFSDDSYPEGYDKDTDFNSLKTLVDKYYTKIRTREYTLQVADWYSNKYQERRDWNEESYSSNFIQFRDSLDSVRGAWPYNLTKYNDVVTYLTNDEEGLVRYFNIEYFFDKANLWDYQSKYEDFRYRFDNNQDISESLLNELETLIKSKFSDYTKTYNTGMNYFKLTISIETPHYYYISKKGEGEFTVVGYIKDIGEPVVNKDFIYQNAEVEEYSWREERVIEYTPTGTNRYSNAITKSTYTQGQVEVMRKDNHTYRYRFVNNIMYKLESIISMVNMLKLVFLIIGLVTAVFAALMLLNFISTSITSKIREIGILRAVGARGSDLFKIFFSESGLITLICLVISLAASIVTSIILNNYMGKEIGVVIMNFGVLNILLMVVGAFVIAFLGTFIPVLIASKKPPVDSIRTL